MIIGAICPTYFTILVHLVIKLRHFVTTTSVYWYKLPALLYKSLGPNFVIILSAFCSICHALSSSCPDLYCRLPHVLINNLLQFVIAPSAFYNMCLILSQKVTHFIINQLNMHFKHRFFYKYFSLQYQTVVYNMEVLGGFATCDIFGVLGHFGLIN